MTPNAGKDVEQLDHSYIAGGNIKWNTSTLENSVVVLLFVN